MLPKEGHPKVSNMNHFLGTSHLNITPPTCCDWSDGGKALSSRPGDTGKVSWMRGQATWTLFHPPVVTGLMAGRLCPQGLVTQEKLAVCGVWQVQVFSELVGQNQLFWHLLEMNRGLYGYSRATRSNICLENKKGTLTNTFQYIF